MKTLKKILKNCFLMPLALFILVSYSAFSTELITDPQLKEWIKSNANKLPGVVVNADGGIDNTATNLEALAKIESLECSNFNLTSIDELIRHMSNLKRLKCYENSLIDLDLSNNIKLEILYCWSNQLTNLDLSNNIKLELLDCSENQLNSLDVSKHAGLKLLYCNDNLLDKLDIRQLINLSELKCCNQADGFVLCLTTEQQNKFTKEDYCDAILTVLKPDLITDPQLKEWIKLNADRLPEVVVDADGGIDNTTTNLEALAKIESLECSNFNLTSINELIRHMPNLKRLKCYKNSLIELDLSNNIELELLYCWSNQLTNLDLSKNIKLELLDCSENQLNKLDVSKHIRLTLLYCNDNLLDRLDISSLINLSELKCCNQADGFILYLTTEQKSKFTEEDYCDAILNVPSSELITNARLKEWIKYNKDQLPGVVVNANGGITSTTTNLEALAEIESLECSDFNLTSIDELIRHMPNLKRLVCSDNQLTILNISNNIELMFLKCNHNQLTNLDVSNNVNLEELHCFNNPLNNIDVTSNIKLIQLGCFNIPITNLDVSKNINLEALHCSGNQLTNLDVSKNINLKLLICSDNQLTNLDLSENINLRALVCSDNQLTNLNISNSTELMFLKCNHNQLTNLDVSNNVNLEELHCFNNPLNNLDVTSNIKLIQLGCFNNQLTNLDVSKNINLQALHCSGNQLTNLDVSRNIRLTLLFCHDNILNSLDIRPLPYLWEFTCCNQAEGFILYLTKQQKNMFSYYNYCNAILKERNGSICEIEGLDIYPNPTSGKFFIESKFFDDEIKILNLAGEVLYRETPNAEKAEIDISSLPAGMYLIKTKGKIGKVIKN